MAAAQTTATLPTNNLVQQILDYAASNPDATIRFQAIEMALHVHTDVSYLFESGARSRAGDIFFFAQKLALDTAPASDTFHLCSQYYNEDCISFRRQGWIAPHTFTCLCKTTVLT